MKIAFVNQPMDGVIPPYQNSIGIWTFQVARRVAQNNEVIVYAKWMRTQKQWQEETGEIEYRFVWALPNKIISKITGFLARFQKKERPVHASILYYLDYILQVALDLRKEKCDFIHIHNFTQFVSVVRAFNPNAKIVLHMNCEWLSQLDQRMIERRMAKADLILGSSDYITEKIRRRFPHFAKVCQTVFNGVDANYFVSQNDNGIEKANSDQRLLFVGRVSPEKGVHDLIDAFGQVAERYPNAKLDIVGPVGELPVDFIINLSDEPEVAQLASLYEESYEIQLRRLVPSHLAEQVSFWGSVPHDKILKHYHNTDILINPSYSESFGMSLVEAMASEKPVVATRVGGMQEIVKEGETGLLVERGNISALAEAIIQLLADAELRQSMGKAGRKRVLSLFDWDQVAESLIKHYEDVVRSEVA